VKGERMITNPLAFLIGKIVVFWTPTSLFSDRLKSIRGYELCFEDSRGWSLL
jgi:hypothetical protein